MKVFTIGFTEKSAEQFFGLLEGSGAKRLLDVRLNNKSQLAGFTKQSDLEFFLRRILGMEYRHVPVLAPTQELLDRYKKEKGSWVDYELEFLGLMRARGVEKELRPELFDEACLLCSEHLPQHCHRRLVLDYLKPHWPSMEVVHLH